jgi:hypothetical protein
LAEAAARELAGTSQRSGILRVDHGPKNYGAVGQVWTAETLRATLARMVQPSWARCIVMHHTAAPSLAQRENGFSVQQIRNIRDFYILERGWNEGPHLFVDEDQIFGMTHLQTRGVHAPKWNSTGIGIEVLGDYDREDPLSGRGLQCWRNAARAASVLCDWLDITPSEFTVLFHRECPVTQRRSGKSCPGTLVEKEWVISLIRAADTA